MHPGPPLRTRVAAAATFFDFKEYDMIWTPIDLDAVAERRDQELLRVAADERIEKRPDPYDGFVYAYTEQDDDEFDGSNCSDEVMGLIRAGLLTDRGGVIRITDAGRICLAEVPA